MLEIPFFGVAVEGDGFAHLYSTTVRPESVCGITLRDMRDRTETEMETCPGCLEWAIEAGKG